MHPNVNTPDEYKRYISNRFQFIHAPKGFIDRNNFEFIFENMLISEIEKRRKELFNLKSKRALIICDGHASRCSAKIMDLGRKFNIDIFILPSHLTHIIQPLDCGINREFKFKIGSFVSGEDSHELPEQRSLYIKSLCSVIDSTLVLGNIVNAWRNSGLFPFNPSRILYQQRIFAPKNTSQTLRGISMVCVF
jgi:hypothetical protein